MGLLRHVALRPVGVLDRRGAGQLHLRPAVRRDRRPLPAGHWPATGHSAAPTYPEFAAIGTLRGLVRRVLSDLSRNLHHPHLYVYSESLTPCLDDLTEP